MHTKVGHSKVECVFSMVFVTKTSLDILRIFQSPQHHFDDFLLVEGIHGPKPIDPGLDRTMTGQGPQKIEKFRTGPVPNILKFTDHFGSVGPWIPATNKETIKMALWALKNP